MDGMWLKTLTARFIILIMSIRKQHGSIPETGLFIIQYFFVISIFVLMFFFCLVCSIHLHTVTVYIVFFHLFLSTSSIVFYSCSSSVFILLFKFYFSRSISSSIHCNLCAALHPFTFKAYSFFLTVFVSE